MKEDQKYDHCHRILSILDRQDECLFIIPTDILRLANLNVGDEFIVCPKANGLEIRKMRQE